MTPRPPISTLTTTPLPYTTLGLSAARGDLEPGRRPAQDLGGFGGDAAIFRRGLGAGLPGAVHLVAKAPEFDVVRGFVPVALAQIGIMRAAGMVAIFEEVLRLGRPARAEVDREHRLDVGGLAPVHEFVGAELVGQVG